MTVEELEIVIKASIAPTQEKINALKKQISSIGQKTNTPDVQVSTAPAQSSLKKLQSEIERTQAKIDKLRGKTAPLYAKQDALAAQYSDVPAVSGSTRAQTVDSMVENDAGIQRVRVQIDPLEAEIARLKSKIADSTGQMNTLRESAGNSAPAVQRLRDRIKSLGDSTQQSTRHVSMLHRMLTRMFLSILIYRGLGGVLRSIGSGMENLAAYSMYMRGTDSEHAIQSMARLSAAGLAVKDAFGAATMQLLNTFLPTIEILSDKLVNAANTVNEFFAALNGQTTYTKATTAAANYTNGLTAAKEATKALKNATIGIDELNILKATQNYSTMFEEAPVSDKMKDVADKINKIKDVIDKIIHKLKDTFGNNWLLKTLGLAALLGLLGKIISAFLRKNAALSSQTVATKAETEAVNAYSTALAPATAAVTNMSTALEGLTVPALSGVLAAITVPALDLSAYKQSVAEYQQAVTAPSVELATAPAMATTAFQTSRAIPMGRRSLRRLWTPPRSPRWTLARSRSRWRISRHGFSRLGPLWAQTSKPLRSIFRQCLLPLSGRHRYCSRLSCKTRWGVRWTGATTS